MTPAIILDVLIAALFDRRSFAGLLAGLFLSLSGILVLIAAMIGANLGAKALTQPVSDWMTPKIEERIAGTVEKTLEKKGQESGQTLEELLPDSLKGLLDRTGLLRSAAGDAGAPRGGQRCRHGQRPLRRLWPGNWWRPLPMPFCTS